MVLNDGDRGCKFLGPLTMLQFHWIKLCYLWFCRVQIVFFLLNGLFLEPVMLYVCCWLGYKTLYFCIWFW